jgi:hypothetical protein
MIKLSLTRLAAGLGGFALWLTTGLRSRQAAMVWGWRLLDLHLRPGGSGLNAERSEVAAAFNA